MCVSAIYSLRFKARRLFPRKLFSFLPLSLSLSYSMFTGLCSSIVVDLLLYVLFAALYVSLLLRYYRVAIEILIQFDFYLLKIVAESVVVIERCTLIPTIRLSCHSSVQYCCAMQFSSFLLHVCNQFDLLLRKLHWFNMLCICAMGIIEKDPSMRKPGFPEKWLGSKALFSYSTLFCPYAKLIVYILDTNSSALHHPTIRTESIFENVVRRLYSDRFIPPEDWSILLCVCVSSCMWF